VRPVRGSGRAGRLIRTRERPFLLVATPDGRTVYAVARDGVTPIRTRTNAAGPAIRLRGVQDVALTPDGRTLFIAAAGRRVYAMPTATNRPGRPIRLGYDARAVAVAPDGRTAWVAGSFPAAGELTPIRVTTRRAGPPVWVGGFPVRVRVAPDGRTVWVTNAEAGTLIPVSVTTRRAGPPVRIRGWAVASLAGRRWSRMLRDRRVAVAVPAQGQHRARRGRHG
jgi:DNA-binding beta-propeller fold protein YncE